ncbi:hypothetical protein M2140_001516 [Clostridiales Family XIII bacterium PM5-7]
MNICTKFKKSAAMLLIIGLVISCMAISQSETAYAASKTITVYVTISDRGEIPSVDNRIMVDVPVEVAAKDDMATVDQVMKAFHKNNKPGGYVFEGYVKKLWGVETGNTLFFINNLSCNSVADSEMVKSGDRIIASVNSDDQYYSDYYTYFNVAKKTATVGTDVVLTLVGHSGMMQNAKAEPIQNAQVGMVTEDGFKAIEGAITDEQGKVTIKMDSSVFTSGQSYYITAKGAVPTTATDWNAEGTPQVDVDAPIIAPVCKVTVQSEIAAGVKATTIKIKSTKGKNYIKLNWTKSKGYKVDYYQVFRSNKKASGYGTKAFYETKTGAAKSYKNTKALKKGNRYYYKVRGVRKVDGKTVYTKWSNVVYRIAI